MPSIILTLVHLNVKLFVCILDELLQIRVWGEDAWRLALGDAGDYWKAGLWSRG